MGQSKDHFDFLGVREAIVLMLERDADVALGPVDMMLIGCGVVAVAVVQTTGALETVVC